MSVEDDIYRARHEAGQMVMRDPQTHDLADAWIGLNLLLKGAWGTESLNHLGGGRTAIKNARDALGRLVVSDA